MSNHEPKSEAGNALESISGLPKWLIAATVAVLGALGWALIEWLSPAKSQWSFPARLVLLTLGGVALLYLVLGLLYLRIWLRSRTREGFGVLWNRRGNPICSKCRAPLTKSDQGFGALLYCPACSIYYKLCDLTTGVSISVRDAYEKMRAKKKFGRQPSAG